MNVQYEKSLHTLELPAVLEMLAAQEVSETAKQNRLNLRPVSERGMVRRRLAETSAAKQMMVLKGSPSFYGIKDVRHSLSRADLGGMLNTTELLAIAKVLTCTRNIRSYGEHDRGLAERTVLDNLFASLRPVNHLEQKSPPPLSVRMKLPMLQAPNWHPFVVRFVRPPQEPEMHCRKSFPLPQTRRHCRSLLLLPVTDAM